MGELIYGKNIGIVGMGTIGKQMVRLLKGFKVNIYAFDRTIDYNFSEKNNVKHVSLNEVFTKSDIISLHLDLNYTTKNLVDLDLLKKMKKNAILVNMARGGLLDEKALYYVLKKKLIAGAGLDVFENEPYAGKLLKLDNTILTPHIGSYAVEIRKKMELESVLNVIESNNFG